MAETGADDTAGAEDDFGLIQEVSSLCPPLSPVPDCTILGIFGRVQEVSNCCLPSLQLALQIVEHMLKFANVAPRWSLAELLFGSPRFHGFDDEAQDGLSLGVH